MECRLWLEENDSSSVAIRVEIRPGDLFRVVLMPLAVSAQHPALK